VPILFFFNWKDLWIRHIQDAFEGHLHNVKLVWHFATAHHPQLVTSCIRTPSCCYKCMIFYLLWKTIAYKICYDLVLNGLAEISSFFKICRFEITWGWVNYDNFLISMIWHFKYFLHFLSLRNMRIFFFFFKHIIPLWNNCLVPIFDYTGRTSQSFLNKLLLHVLESFQSWLFPSQNLLYISSAFNNTHWEQCCYC